ncbi:hypothetical protein [Gloeobacter kilaueensis]|uniref:Uncharacterized protein n=1 Tax=Gloeobacter kilaueensis (strain ATCC BAA-2537 / CCAP 1431/1 / ULC 316 / JS1) TaxID=1183438 RepID=U5QKD8_GLOK1|nr:hypothetical protein [Gloeobacter kilaueensis]AGY58160.1 hypothetical protein GKIL_1914 [Gloeobacter kilaueensis JS1]
MATYSDIDRRGKLFWPLEWILLIVASVNLVWVIFDVSYVPLRDLYLLNLPQVTRWYDPIKGIEPFDTTTAYLQTVDQYKAAVSSQNPDQQKALLASLRSQSALIIQENSFQQAEKQGALERIKNRIRKHMGQKSSTESFQLFWSEQNLTPARRADELKFFDTKLRPLYAVNYFRHYGEDGDYVDLYFWRYDLWFMLVFVVELLLRTVVTRRQHPNLSWQQAAAENSFDLINVLPAINLIPGVHLGWIALGRLFTYSNRLQRLGVFPSPIAALIHRYSASIANEVTDLVVVKVLGQLQDAVRDSDFSRMLPGASRSSTASPTPVDGFVRTQTQLVVKEVLPQVRPELERLIAHTIRQSLPLANGLAGNLAKAAVNAAYGAANGAIKADPEGERLARQLTDKLLSVLGSEWREHGTARDAQQLLLSLLEQAKRDYIRRNDIETDLLPRAQIPDPDINLR